MLSLFGVSRRWEMMFLLLSGLAVVYTLRVNMSVAAPGIAADLGWNEIQLGLVLSSFYWGYAVGQIPASLLAQITGAKWLFGFSILLPALLTFFLPAACRHSIGMAMFLRCLIGFFQSSCFPSVYHFFPHWIPIKEKSSMVSVVMSGMYVGDVIGFSVAGAIVKTGLVSNGITLGSWSGVFYIFAALGVLWFPYWTYKAYETPEQHPYISLEEIAIIHEGKNYEIQESNDLEKGEEADTMSVMRQRSNLEEGASYPHGAALGEKEGDPTQMAYAHNSKIIYHLRSHQLADHHSLVVKPKHTVHSALTAFFLETPWCEFFSRPQAWVLVHACFANGYVGFMLLSEMPSFISHQLGFDLSTAGVLSMVPFVALLVTTLSSGMVFSYLQLNHGWSVKRIRMTAHFIGFGASSGLLLAAGFSTNTTASYILIILAQGSVGFNQAGVGCSFLDIAPVYSGPFNTFGNNAAAIAGILGPIIVGKFLERWPNVWGWRYSFIVNAAISFSVLVSWFLFHTSDIIPELNSPSKRHVARSLCSQKQDEENSRKIAPFEEVNKTDGDNPVNKSSGSKYS